MPRLLNKANPGLEDIERILQSSPRRFSFADKNPFFKQFDDGSIGFFVSFPDSIEQFLRGFEGLENLHFIRSYNGNWYSNLSGTQKQTVEEILQRFKPIVYIRDILDCSIAISMNMTAPGEHTKLGRLEEAMKYKGDMVAQDEILNLLKEVIDNTPLLSEADFICCVPSTRKIMLPLAAELSAHTKKPDLSEKVNWKNPDTKSAKDCPEAVEKLYLCNNKEIEFSQMPDMKGKSVLLLDDLYQSGATMQYTAMCLKSLGCAQTYGLSLVKALKNN